MENKEKVLARKKRYTDKFDIIMVQLPKGTKDKITDLGYSYNKFGQIAILDYLERLIKR